MGHRMGYRKRSLGVGAGLGLCLLGPGAWAAEGAAACAAEAGDQARLACYDRLFRAAPAAPVAPEAGRPATLQPDRAAADGMLTERWGLGEEADRRLFRIHAHRPTYILPVRWSNAPNHQPTSPNPDNQVASPDSLKAAEAKYQISFKTLAYSDHWFGQRADLWLGYTQQSSWQVYDRKNSAPFRETDYEPEAMLVLPLDTSLGRTGLRLRMAGLGVNHQSNGRANPYSRSWNRIMGQVGLESDEGDFAVLLRGWQRMNESADKDDNPDITHYLGHADVQFLWRAGRNGFGVNLRGTPSHAAAKVDWSYQLHGGLRAYVQLFSGYGESLIDYNHRQTTLGFGISLVDWF